jgi:K+-sensing histidine kinase KdpD
MTVIVGHAQTLAKREDQSVSGPATSIADRGQALHRLSEKARSIERLVAEGTGERSTVDLAGLVAEVVADQREAVGAESTADATVDVSVPSTQLSTNRPILEAVLENAIENAIRHHDRPDPTVRIRLESTAEGIDLLVEDDGPGLPEHERETIESGSESALQHASGLGLWVITWGVETLGGTVSFEEREPRGTRVRISLPTLELGQDAPAEVPSDGNDQAERDPQSNDGEVTLGDGSVEAPTD